MFGGFSGEVGFADWGVLLVGFAGAAWLDLRTREAPDRLWVVLGAAGVTLGFVALAGTGLGNLLGWAAVSALVLQHFLPWDVPVEKLHEALPGIVELLGYLAVAGVLLDLSLGLGIGDGGLAPAVWAAYAAILVARGLFELGLLYGGADAKALIAAAALIPLAPPALLAVPEGASRIASVVPGPVTLLMNAALLSVAIPLALFVRNLRAGALEGTASFTGYRIPVAELTERFVWVRDPTFGGGSSEAERDVETSEDDLALRRRQRAELEAQGVREVWVTPQIPFLVFFLLGGVAAAAAGNLLFDLLGLV